MNTWFFIPARKNSKGIKNKNRKLLDFTIRQIPSHLHASTIVSTDDEEILSALSEKKMILLRREEKFSQDDTCIRDVVVDAIHKLKIPEQDRIVLLYLTYPDRKWDTVEEVIKFYDSCSAKSLLCAHDVKIHPYICFYELPGNKGKQVVDHDLYRRQDYPKCFQLTHCVTIFDVNELKNLNKNVYNKDTIFYKLPNTIDIDAPEDYKHFLKERGEK